MYLEVENNEERRKKWFLLVLIRSKFVMLYDNETLDSFNLQYHPHVASLSLNAVPILTSIGAASITLTLFFISNNHRICIRYEIYYITDMHFE